MDKLEGRGMSFGRLGGGEEEAGLSGGGALILWCSLTGALSRDGRAVSRGPRRPLGSVSAGGGFRVPMGSGSGS